MPRPSASRLTAAISLTAACLLAASLSGCSVRAAGTGVVVPLTSPPAVGTGAGGAGSLTVDITSPVTVSGHVDAAVTCSTGRIYRAAASSAVIEGTTFSISVNAPAYHGPGTYTSTVGVTVIQGDGGTTAVGALPGIPVTITETGGSFAVSAAGSNGRTVSGSVQWACS